MKKYFIRLAGLLKKWLEQILSNENEKNFRILYQTSESRRKFAKKLEQGLCTHIAGGNPLSETQDVHQRTSIVWHRTDLGIDIGLCTNCQRLFQPSDPDYVKWRTKPSFNRLSAAGVRSFWDPTKAANFEYSTSDSGGAEFAPPSKLFPFYKTQSKDFKIDETIDPWLLDKTANLTRLQVV